VTLDRAAEEAAILAHIAAHGVTRLDSVDPVERALDQWRAEKENKAGSGGGLRAMMNARQYQKRMKPAAVSTLATPVEPKPKRSHKKKVAPAQHPRACAAHGVIDCSRCREGAESWFAAAMQGPVVADIEWNAAEKVGPPCPVTASALSARVGEPEGCGSARAMLDRVKAPGPPADAQAIAESTSWYDPVTTKMHVIYRDRATELTIAELAYELWEISGRCHGDDVRHWLTAERILRGVVR
jgi:hypothetical protein